MNTRPVLGIFLVVGYKSWYFPLLVQADNLLAKGQLSFPVRAPKGYLRRGGFTTKARQSYLCCSPPELRRYLSWVTHPEGIHEILIKPSVDENDVEPSVRNAHYPPLSWGNRAQFWNKYPMPHDGWNLFCAGH